MVINTTILVMLGEPSMKIDLSVLTADVIVTDIIYTPLATPILKQAKELFLKTVDGLGMLLHQNTIVFKRWFGHKPEVTKEVRNHILFKLAERKG